MAPVERRVRRRRHDELGLPARPEPLPGGQGDVGGRRGREAGRHVDLRRRVPRRLPDHGSYREVLASQPSPSALLREIEARETTIPDQWQVQVQARVQEQARVVMHTATLSAADLAERAPRSHRRRDRVDQRRARSPRAGCDAVRPPGGSPDHSLPAAQARVKNVRMIVTGGGSGIGHAVAGRGVGARCVGHGVRRRPDRCARWRAPVQGRRHRRRFGGPGGRRSRGGDGGPRRRREQRGHRRARDDRDELDRRVAAGLRRQRVRHRARESRRDEAPEVVAACGDRQHVLDLRDRGAARACAVQRDQGRGDVARRSRWPPTTSARASASTA